MKVLTVRMVVREEQNMVEWMSVAVVALRFQKANEGGRSVGGEHHLPSALSRCNQSNAHLEIAAQSRRTPSPFDGDREWSNEYGAKDCGMFGRRSHTGLFSALRTTSSMGFASPNSQRKDSSNMNE